MFDNYFINISINTLEVTCCDIDTGKSFSIVGKGKSLTEAIGIADKYIEDSGGKKIRIDFNK